MHAADYPWRLAIMDFGLLVALLRNFREKRAARPKTNDVTTMKIYDLAKQS